MGNILLYASVLFFLCFGVISFFSFFADFVYETKYLKNKTIYTVVTMENEACSAENIARAVKFKVEKSCSGVCDSKIIFVDKKSSDATYQTLKCYEKSEGGIIALKSEEFCKKLEFL